MGPTLEAFVVAMNTVTLVCGGLVTLYAVRAYRRTGARALGSLAIGLAFVTAGALLAGGLHQLVGLDFETGVGVQSAFTAVGFAVLAHSLYTSWENPGGQSSM